MWNPLTDTTPIHTWLHPWLPPLGNRLDIVYPTIRFRMPKGNVCTWLLQNVIISLFGVIDQKYEYFLNSDRKKMRIVWSKPFCTTRIVFFFSPYFRLKSKKKNSKFKFTMPLKFIVKVWHTLSLSSLYRWPIIMFRASSSDMVSGTGLRARIFVLIQ